MKIPPKDDARFQPLRADAENNWREWNPKLVKKLEQSGQLNERLDRAATRAVEIFQQAEENGLAENQAQELANQELFLPSESLPEDEELENEPA